MPAVVQTKVVLPGPRQYIVKLNGDLSGGQETGVIKITKANLKRTSDVLVTSQAPSAISIFKVVYSITGVLVTMLWDTSPQETLFQLTGFGHLDYEESSGLLPTQTGGTGNVLLTTTAIAAAAPYNYDITLYCRLS